MVNFDELKERALVAANTIADKSVEFARVAGDKAKVLGRIAKLNTEIAVEKDSVRKNFAEIGKIYYEQNKANPAPEMMQACADITVALELVEMKKQEAEQLKKQLADDFDMTVEDMETPEEAAKAAAEAVAEAEAVVDEMENDNQ